ncbi:MAG TPA: hypothetical protein VFR78_00980 [Pyrinomonadaceae bacterium]|nr:hypothetical protein [Pyrinomonadaceae bacterium]
MTNHAVPQDFIKRLHETIAWCAPRVDISNPKYCLRSAELRPDYDFSSDPEADIDLWADIPMISRLVASRSQLLTPSTLTQHDIDLHGGRLLIHFLGESNHNNLTADITSYFLDDNDTPPWDTWIQAFIPELWFHQSPHEPSRAFPFLISWVPPEFLEKVNEATECECVGMLMWADAPRRWDGPPDYAQSIPAWLEQLL